jgi:hypothetical protein
LSTNISLPRTGARLAIVPLASLLLLPLVLGCAHSTSSKLADLCGGDDVTARVALVIDSVASVGGGELARLRDERFDIIINLFNPPTPTRCADRAGEASVEIGDLPDELASAAAGAGNAHWRVDSLEVVVELNRGVRDNNLSLALPLDGSDGHWTLSRFPGVAAKGRLLME